MIRTPKIAYRIGFSSALDPNTISVYQEMVKWKWDTSTREIEEKLAGAFMRGYRKGIKEAMLVRATIRQHIPGFDKPILVG